MNTRCIPCRAGGLHHVICSFILWSLTLSVIPVLSFPLNSMRSFIKPMAYLINYWLYIRWPESRESHCFNNLYWFCFLSFYFSSFSPPNHVNHVLNSLAWYQGGLSGRANGALHSIGKYNACSVGALWIMASVFNTWTDFKVAGIKAFHEMSIEMYFYDAFYKTSITFLIDSLDSFVKDSESTSSYCLKSSPRWACLLQVRIVWNLWIYCELDVSSEMWEFCL